MGNAVLRCSVKHKCGKVVDDLRDGVALGLENRGCPRCGKRIINRELEQADQVENETDEKVAAAVNAVTTLALSLHARLP